ncbi:barstar family protein [Anaerovorax odorimutans]|uniref:Barstar family protein n=1 Tax=Anaerovorax odorimutans TaxID=109327 RepID=A0ABT1RJ63_9FIRM|nr:barstar family protein [Anaerovorax odorimutans]MCQ4635227.1 barstar family protein [Anaerovorax odorimutans]
MREIYLEGKELVGEFHQYLKKALDLPDYYGCNLDALYDCLTDIGQESRIYIKGSQLVGQELLAVFREAAQENEYLLLELR